MKTPTLPERPGPETAMVAMRKRRSDKATRYSSQPGASSQAPKSSRIVERIE